MAVSIASAAFSRLIRHVALLWPTFRLDSLLPRIMGTNAAIKS
jgi:hypothetical protein